MPIHSFLVHFPIACWLLGSAVMLAGVATRRESWWQVSWFLLSCACVSAIAAVLSGQQAIQNTDQVSDLLARHRDLGNQLPWPMGLLILAYVHSRFAKRGLTVPRWLLCLGVMATCVLVVRVGHLGGRAVREGGANAAQSLIQKK